MTVLAFKQSGASNDKCRFLLHGRSTPRCGPNCGGARGPRNLHRNRHLLKSVEWLISTQLRRSGVDQPVPKPVAARANRPAVERPFRSFIPERLLLKADTARQRNCSGAHARRAQVSENQQRSICWPWVHVPPRRTGSAGRGGRRRGASWRRRGRVSH